jgi:myosin VIIa
MGDMAEAKYDEDDDDNKKRPVMQKLTETLGRSSIKSKGYQVTTQKTSNSFTNFRKLNQL